MAEAIAPQQAGIQLKHLSPVIGTEVLGIDLAQVNEEITAWLSVSSFFVEICLPLSYQSLISHSLI